MSEKLPWQRRSKPLPEPHLARLQKRMAKGQSLEEAAEGVGLTLPLAKSVFIRSGLPIPKPIRRPQPRGVQDPERIARIVAARTAGRTMTAIAEAEGLSLSRVSQVLAMHSPRPSVRSNADLGKRIHDHLRKVDRAPAADVARALGVRTPEVRKAVWPQDRHRLLSPQRFASRYPDSSVLIGLQVMSLERGRLEGASGRVPVSAAWWDSHRDPAVHPPSTFVRERFGDWSNACRSAGIPLRNQVRPAGASRRWTDEALQSVLREFFARGQGSSSNDYLEWAQDRPDTPSLATVANRFGSWNQAREKARV